MSARRDHHRSGYVLIEALATLALSALVLAGAASIVSIVLRAADRTAMAVETLETTDRAMEAVARDIRSAVRVHRTANGAPTLVFTGSPERLMLVLERAEEDGLTRPVVVTWTSGTGDSGGGRLTRSEAPLVPGVDTPEAGTGDIATVDTGPAVIRFAYFGPVPQGAGEVLTDEWTIPGALPHAVRLGHADPVTLEVSRSVRVGIRAEAELGCAHPAAGYCSLTPGRMPEPTDPGRLEPRPGQKEQPDGR